MEGSTHGSQDPMMESCTKEPKNLLNDSHIAQESEGAEPVEVNDASHHESLPPTTSVDEQREGQGIVKSPCDTTCDQTSIPNKSTAIENSEEEVHNARQPEPANDKNGLSDDALDETSRSLSPTNAPEHKQSAKTTSDTTSLCDLEESCLDASTENQSEREISFSRGRPRKEKRIIKCEYCGRPFNHASAYIIHRRVHTGEKPFSCQLCSRAFAQLSNLRSHMKVHNVPRVLSVQNSSRFQSRSPVSKSMTQTQAIMTAGFRNDKTGSPFRRSRKPVACPICGKIFPYKSVLKIHLRIHSGEKPYSCRVCGKAFTQACTVRVHERVHWSIKPFLCSKCGKGFSQIGTLKAHTCAGKRQVHATLKEMELAGVVTFRCHLCKKCFSTREEYDPHIQTHTDNQRFFCDTCGQRYSLQSELETHKKYCFSMWLAKTKPYGRPSVRLQSKQHSKTVQSSNTENAEFAPVKSPKLSSPEACLLKTPKSEFLQPQKKKKYLSLLTCPPKMMATSIYDPQNNISYCQPFRASYFVSQLNSLDQKSDPRKYLCPRCGRLFRHVGRLRAHMLTHSRNKSFTCGDCGRVSENWSKFWLHQRVHKQRRGRFFCPSCGQGFRFASVYMDHLQQHPELNAYFCPFCPHTFADAKSLKIHQQEWHQSSMPHICDFCGKGFTSPVILKRHRVVHLQNRQADTPYIAEEQLAVKPYECGKCNASFKTVDMLFGHQLCHSPNGNISLSLTNGINHEDEELQGEPQEDHNTNHVSNSTSHVNTSDLCRETSPLMPLTDAVKTLDIDPSISQGTTALPPSSSDSESLPVETEEVNESIGSVGKAEETIQELDVATPQSRLGQESGHLECTECGACFALLPALHRHYLKHARGEI